MNNYILRILDEGETLITKFGRANIWGDCYKITSKKEGNNRKPLDRLIYEDFHGVSILKNIFINHKDGNKLNNNINNLELLSKSDYWVKNISNEKHSNPAWRMSDSSRMKISEANRKKSRKWSSERKEELSRKTTSTGIYHVSSYMMGMKKRWKYSYIEEGKRKNISSIDILKLKIEVKSRNLEWFVLDEEKANSVAVECGLSLSDLL